MPATGFIQLRAFTSNAQFPLKDVAITVTASDGTAIAMRLTDRNGLITPIEIPVPDREESLQPDPPERPFATVNLYAVWKKIPETAGVEFNETSYHGGKKLTLLSLSNFVFSTAF